MSEIRLKKHHIEKLLLLAVLVFPGILFGFTGLKTSLGFFVVVILPAYLATRPINIDKDEKVIFSFFLGIVYFPLFVWYVDRIVPSLRFSIIAAFILAISAGIILNRKLNRASS